MAIFDLSPDQLKAYKPDRTEPPDYDAFWEDTLREARTLAKPAIYEPVDTGLRHIDSYDVTFTGFAGQPIKAWLQLPRARSPQERLPVVVEFVGYGGGRGLATNHTLWPAAGYAHFVMDTRGQGSAWGVGATPDVETEPGSPQFPGFMTRGILKPTSYYYRRVMTDAVRAVETAAVHPAIDADRIAVSGGSQGGGLSLAAAGLLPSMVKVAMPDVPFLCHFRRAGTLTDGAPYLEIQKFLVVHRDKVDIVFDTLDYFDGVNFSARARAKALFSVAMMDEVCPPSTVYAAYNHYAGEKDIRIYRFNHHEGGGEFQTREKVNFLRGLFG